MVGLEQFTLTPAPRCYGRLLSGAAGICGSRAQWMEPNTAAGIGAFYCDFHHRPCDVPIASTAPIRRVRVTLDVFLAGASWSVAEAHDEAVARVARAVEPVGAYLDVKLVTSIIGQPRVSALWGR